MTNTKKMHKVAEKLAQGGFTRKQKSKLVHQWAELAKSLLKGNR